MSGRSAYVRKEKTKVKDASAGVVANSRHVHSSRGPPSDEYSMGYNNEQSGYDTAYRPGPARSVVSTGSDEFAYARVRKPPTPVIEVSGIEKSAFREMMDKRSEGVRKGLASLSFGKKKKKAEADEEHKRPGTSAAVPAGVYEVEAPAVPPPMPTQARNLHHKTSTTDMHSPHPMPGPPPNAKLPPVPAGPQLKRWTGAGRAPQPWNKLRKDPELWDPQGDTLVYLGHETINSSRPPPSFRVSSHVLEATESKFFNTILREGYTDSRNDFEIPPTPDSAGAPGSRAHKKFGSIQSRSSANTQDPDGQISYEIYFPAPLNLNKLETLRHHATTRNIFALLYQASLVGLSLFQALVDLQERLQMYMSPELDAAALIIDYITVKGIDDVRDDPATATSLLAWSEFNSVRWLEGWREAFIHCSGMLYRLDDVPEYRRVTPITKALIERASLEVQVRVQSVEDRLVEFEFSDMWPTKRAVLPPEQAAFERLRLFFKGFYEGSFGSWPAPAPAGAEQWLTRSLVRRLQKDFGALYDYLVDRDVVWDGSEERSTRKWNIISTNASKTVTVDSAELPMTDILVSFDNRNRYPHIPHPYPLVPDSVPPRYNETSASSKTNKKNPQKPVDDKVAERKAALAYTEATNIYILGPNFVDNKLVDAFVRFEKLDRVSEVDPCQGRRGRWVLIYAILQVLASISVDNPAVKYKDEVIYHLNPRLRGTPPWKTGEAEIPEPAHELSHCWLVPKTWIEQNESPRSVGSPRNNYGPGILSVRSSAAHSVATESDAGSSRYWGDDVPQLEYGKRKPAKRSVRSSGAPSVGTESDTSSSLVSPVSTARRMNRMAREIDYYPVSAGYGPGIQKVEEKPVVEWPIREESRNGTFMDSSDLVIKDFDDYNF